MSNNLNKTPTGKQTQITENIKKLARSIHGDGVIYIHGVSDYIKAMTIKDGKEPDFTRIADEILNSGWYNGCNETGVVFAALLRAKGIPTTFIQALNKKAVISFNEKGPNLKGHVFLRIKLNEKEKIVNSTTGKITDDLPIEFIVGNEGLDAWDIGLRKGFDDLKVLFMKKK